MQTTLFCNAHNGSNVLLSQTDTNSIAKNEDINPSKLDKLKHENYKRLETNNYKVGVDGQYHGGPYTYLGHVWWYTFLIHMMIHIPNPTLILQCIVQDL